MVYDLEVEEKVKDGLFEEAWEATAICNACKKRQKIFSCNNCILCKSCLDFKNEQRKVEEHRLQCEFINAVKTMRAWTL